MKQDQDYINDLAEIRAMMARSSKFLTLSGWSGIFAGIYAILGVSFAYFILDFNPQELHDSGFENGIAQFSKWQNIILLGIAVLILTFGTAVLLSNRKANKTGEILWNATSKNMMMNLAVPLIAGGFAVLAALSLGLTGWILPFSLLFYGLALFNAGNFTFHEIKTLGILEIILGIFSLFVVQSGLLCWMLGFGLLHIIYGLFMHYRYER